GDEYSSLITDPSSRSLIPLLALWRRPRLLSESDLHAVFRPPAEVHVRLAITGTLLCAAQLSAQQITGVVRDSILTWPIPGAVVSLFDSAGHPLARGITNQRG